MTIYSMTGFGRGMARDGEIMATCDIRSVNHRYCDLHFRMPRIYAPLEVKIRDMVTEKLERGRVDISLSVIAPSSDSGKIGIDMELADSYRKQLKKLQKNLNLSGDIEIGDIIVREGVLRFVENPEAPVKAHWPVVSQAVGKALKALQGMRRKEGAALKKELNFHLGALKALARNLEKEIPTAVEAIKTRFTSRIGEMSTSSGEIDPDRIAQEIALMISKSDVTEEVARLKAHLAQVETFLKEGSPAGKRLDFIMQEIHREITTFGNKLQSRDVSRLLVEAKSTAEKMREQIQNLE